MGWLLGIALVVIFVLDIVIFYLASELGEARRDNKADLTSEHAKCIAHVADMTSKRVVALAFRDAAHRFDSVEEVPALTTLRRAHKENGPSVPALWLSKQADILDLQ